MIKKKHLLWSTLIALIFSVVDIATCSNFIVSLSLYQSSTDKYTPSSYLFSVQSIGFHFLLLCMIVDFAILISTAAQLHLLRSPIFEKLRVKKLKKINFILLAGKILFGVCAHFQDETSFNRAEVQMKCDNNTSASTDSSHACNLLFSKDFFVVFIYLTTFIIFCALLSFHFYYNIFLKQPHQPQLEKPLRTLDFKDIEFSDNRQNFSHQTNIEISPLATIEKHYLTNATKKVNLFKRQSSINASSAIFSDSKSTNSSPSKLTSDFHFGNNNNNSQQLTSSIQLHKNYQSNLFNNRVEKYESNHISVNPFEKSPKSHNNSDEDMRIDHQNAFAVSQTLLPPTRRSIISNTNITTANQSNPIGFLKPQTVFASGLGQNSRSSITSIGNIAAGSPNAAASNNGKPFGISLYRCSKNYENELPVKESCFLSDIYAVPNDLAAHMNSAGGQQSSGSPSNNRSPSAPPFFNLGLQMKKGESKRIDSDTNRTVEEDDNDSSSSNDSHGSEECENSSAYEEEEEEKTDVVPTTNNKNRIPNKYFRSEQQPINALSLAPSAYLVSNQITNITTQAVKGIASVITNDESPAQSQRGSPLKRLFKGVFKAMSSTVQS